ncbi:hypothetical protein BG015_008205 [Linnemannia schmuckeri]|uniref:Arrestin C-terminal-like domain-containing protein n=1 Tax=Linnemannia schmuckeri TaxID=64567 RepID=A0A9P5S0V0_9FUNG|nr:hypothetical protein BG015_008205 [Linnemannia schmuckeri]
MRFFSKHSSANIAATYLAPSGLSISLATKNGQPRRYGPGTIIHGQVNLSLSKPILRPCQLRVVFSCTTTLDLTAEAADHNNNKDDLPSSSTPVPTTTIFEVEHLLIDDQTLPACGRHAPLHFCVKLPLCNYPPSMEEGERLVSYTLQAILSFDADLGNGSIVKASTSSTPNKIMYMPHVSYAAAMVGGAQQARPGVTNAAAVATASCRPTPSSAPLHETGGQLVVESRSGTKTINASVQSKTSVCIGDHTSMILKVENDSDITLQAIRLALVRQISFPSSPNNSPKIAGSLSSHSVHTSSSSSYTSPISTTVHAATIPVAKVSNRNSTWTQQLQFRIPSHLNLLPSVNKSITPLLNVEYFIVLSLPIPQRQGGFVSRLAASTRKRPSIDLSIFHSHSSSPPSSTTASDASHLLSTSPPGSSDVSSSSKTPTVLQLAPIPITLTSVPSYADGRKSRPIPHHMEVEDRPTFVRDRFEEEMIQQLSCLESLVMDDGDDDDLDIDLLVEEACRRRRRRDASSSEDSDDDNGDEGAESEEEDEEEDSRVPARFRKPYRNSSLPTPSSNSGLSTPPPSPPYLAKAMSDDAMMVQTMRERSFARNMAISNSNALPSIAAVAALGGRLPLSSTLGPKACGLSKDLLMDLHQSKGQQPRSSV